MTTAAVEGTISSGGGNHLAFQAPADGEKHAAVSSKRLGRSVVPTSGTNSPKGPINSNAEETSPKSSGKEQADMLVQNKKSSTIPNSVANYPGIPSREGISDSRESPDSIIDSALLAALRDPRERLGLLKLEQAMIDFCHSSDGYIEVGGPFNSIVISPTTGFISGQNVNSDRPQTTFQRCILHRLADRFHIVRENGNLYEGYIRLVKLKESRIPKSLLVNLDSSEYNNSVDETSRSMESMTIAGLNGNATAPATNSKPRNRKMKIMKRSSSGDSSRNSNNDSRTPRKGKNFSDKEKAYAEARARIFAEEQGEKTSNPGTPASTSAAPSPTTTPPTSQHGSNSFSSLDAASAADNDSEKRASRNAVNKATWRNRQQEENDPDFQRGGPMVVQPQTYTTADVYAGFAAAGATPAYPPQTFYPATTQDATAAYYASQGVQQAQAQQQQQQQAAYYNAAGRGRGGRGAYGAANPQQRYYAANGAGNGNIYYQQQQQQQPSTLAQQNYRRAGSGDVANVNSLDEFPSLR
jgi:hypothetical protein